MRDAGAYFSAAPPVRSGGQAGRGAAAQDGEQRQAGGSGGGAQALRLGGGLDGQAGIVGEMAFERGEMRPIFGFQRKARGAEAERLLARGGLERVDGAAQIGLEDLRRVEPAGVVPEIMAGDLVAVGGDARDDVGAFLRDDAGGEEGQARAAQVVLAESLDRGVGAPEGVGAQGAVLGDGELAFEVVRDVLEVDAEPGFHGVVRTCDG